MIPFRLRLHNFLSYQDAVLDFQGLHTACICGSNGAGKSSLLEAITWVLWGQSRAVLEDDVIHLGAQEAQVDFIFENREQLYRVIRQRHRKQSVLLEFQVAVNYRAGRDAASNSAKKCELDSTERKSGEIEAARFGAEKLGAEKLGAEKLDAEKLGAGEFQFRTLTAKGVRATQQLIIQTLRLDYDTFINSAYLRQGRADEFMLKRPNERKQVLADLLKLDQYDHLAEKAKDQVRHYRAQVQVLSQNLGQVAQSLEQKAEVEQELTSLSVSLAALQQEQERDGERIQQLQQQQQQREAQAQQLLFLQQECDRLQQSQAQLLEQQHQQQAQQAELQAHLEQAPAIQAGYQQWQQLQHIEEEWAEKAKQHQEYQAQQQEQERHFHQQIFEQERQREGVRTRLKTLDQQEVELQPILAREADILEAAEKLHQARDHLKILNQREAKASPLLQRYQRLETQLKTEQTRVVARLEALREERQALEKHCSELPQLQAKFEALLQEVDGLERRDRYREEVRNKGQERRMFLERLQVHQLDAEAQLSQLDQKLAILEQPEAHCPCCDRPLKQNHREFARSRYQEQRQSVIEQLTVFADQISVSEKEIEVFRQEYRAVNRELKGYKAMLQRKGELKQQLTVHLEQLQHYQQLMASIERLEDQLSRQAYAPELQAEWHQLQATLAELDYDDRNHALARGEVERWRWVQIKQSELRQAHKKLKRLAQQRPLLLQEQQQLQDQIQSLQQTQQDQQAVCQEQLTALNYDPNRHQEIRQDLRQAQVWQLRQQALVQAQKQLPQLQQQQAQLKLQQEQQQSAEAELCQQIQVLREQLDATPDLTTDLNALETQRQNRRHRLDRHLAEQGKLQQRQQQLAELAQQYQQQQTELDRYRYQQRVHQELVQAFGKNGIQALMIENLLPQLEAETNQILARLSNHQLHVQFITQKAKTQKTKNKKINNQKTNSQSTKHNGCCRGKHSKGEAEKGQDKRPIGVSMIDTLDIRIADAKGTRPYETYSGGEAFRVNFSIRLALAKLLAQRAGTSLQLLIVDEGFGTQDVEGCDRLIAALNAIAPDFARILTITHMPQFKEAFQARIEVSKTEQGSKLAIAV